MAHRLIFNPAVTDDLVEALNYYESISPALANRFRAGVRQCLSDISDRPQSFPLDSGTIRFARVPKFPYLIFFVAKPKFVTLVAILHGSSDPEKRRKR